FVTATDELTGQALQLFHGSGNTWAPKPGDGLTMGVGTGGHDIVITWKQTSGNVAGTACGPGPGNPKPCTGTFGVQQRTVAGSNGENACVSPAVDSGPNAAVTIGDADVGSTSAANAFASDGKPKNLVVTVNISGLANANTGDPPVCLRVAVQQDHQTGIIDCGQGNGNSQDILGIKNGCPDPVQINTRLQADGTLTCTPALNPLDCVTTTQGQRNIMSGFEDVIDPGGNPNSCLKNNWLDPVEQPKITLDDDPRAFVMIITAPADLSNQTGNTTVPIRNFAVFYVTGWSDKGKPNDAGCKTTGAN